MTSDYALLSVLRDPMDFGLLCWKLTQLLLARERPTESLILSTKRRFFPFRIPNLSV